jgi:hypothetical protein
VNSPHYHCLKEPLPCTSGRAASHLLCWIDPYCPIRLASKTTPQRNSLSNTPAAYLFRKDLLLKTQSQPDGRRFGAANRNMKLTRPWSMWLEITIIVTVSYLILFGAFATIIQMRQEMLAAESVTRLRVPRQGETSHY